MPSQIKHVAVVSQIQSKYIWLSKRHAVITAQHYTYQRDLTGFVLPLRWLREWPKYLSQDHSGPKETVADRFAHYCSFPSNTVASSCLVKELNLGRLGSLKKCNSDSNFELNFCLF